MWVGQIVILVAGPVIVWARKPCNADYNDNLTELTREETVNQCVRGVKTWWTGYSSTLFGTHRDAVGELIDCKYEYVHLVELTTSVVTEKVGTVTERVVTKRLSSSIDPQLSRKVLLRVGSVRGSCSVG